MVYIEIMTCEGESEISPQPLYLYNDKIVGNRNQVAADFRQWGLQLVLWLPSANTPATSIRKSEQVMTRT